MSPIAVSYTHLDVYKRQKRDNSPNPDQIEMLIRIYNRYQHVFSDIPGKVKNYQCVLKFK